MSKIIKRVVAGVMMSAVVLGATIGVSSASQIRYKALKSDAAAVMTVNGTEIKADEYAAYMIYNMRYYENMYAQYGMSGLWDDPESAQQMGAMMPEATKQQVATLHVILDQFKKSGLKLTAAQQKDLTKQKEDLIDQIGQQQALTGGDASKNGKQAYLDTIQNFGFNEQLYDNYLYINECYSALNESLFGEGGTEAATDEELMQYFQDNYLAAKHILILTKDPNTGEVKRTEEQAKADAQKVLDRLNAGEDFDTVMKEVSEDSGLEGNPDGYIFTDGDMMQEFYDGAKALKEGEVSGLVKSDYGYHIIKRIPVDYAGQLENYRSVLSSKLGKTMDSLVNQWMQEADIQTTDLYNQITYENVYDYAVVPKPGASTDASASTDGAAATDGAASAPAGEDAAAAPDAAQ